MAFGVRFSMFNNRVIASGGYVTYTDSSGLNPRTSGPYPGGYTVRTFLSSGTFSISHANIPLTYLVVAGGGSGGGQTGYSEGGGGGAGGYLTGTTVSTVGSLNVTVGMGGPGIYNSTGNNGQNSSFSGVLAYGGGGGGSRNGNINGNGGGSGGGAGIGPGGQGSGGAGADGQGVAGGVNTFDARNGGGLNAVNSITGTSQTYSQNGISYYPSQSTYGSGGTGTGGSTSGAGIQGIVVIRHRNL